MSEQYAIPWAKAWILLVILGAVYLASRLVNIMVLPIFFDEAHYTLSSALIGNAPLQTDPFIEVAYSGVPPLFTWLTAPLTRIVSDPLLAGRLASTFIGLAGLIGTWWCGKVLGGRALAAIAALLYLVCPFMVMYQRMALVDGLLATIGAYSLLSAICLARAPNRRVALWLGCCIALGILAKITGPLLLLLPVIAVVAAPAGTRRSVYRWSFIAVTIGLVAIAVLILNPDGASLIAVITQQQRFGTSFMERTLSQSHVIAESLWLYVTPPVLALAVLGLYRTRDEPGTRILTAWAVLSIVPFMFVHLNLNPRYLLPGVVPLLLLSAQGALILRQFAHHLRPIPWQAGTAALLLISLAASVWADKSLITDPAYAALPALDRFQYVTGWPSGYSLVAALHEAKRLARGHPFTLISAPRNPPGDELEVLIAHDHSAHLVFHEFKTLEHPGAFAQYHAPVFIIVSLYHGEAIDPRPAHLHLVAHASNSDGNGGTDVYQP